MAKNIFISFPYNHKSKDVMEKRITVANLYAYGVTLKQNIPFAPAIIGHKMLEEAKRNGITALDTDFSLWEKFCYSYLLLCNEVHVLMIPGWEDSKGVLAEVTWANRLGIKVNYIDMQ